MIRSILLLGVLAMNAVAQVPLACEHLTELTLQHGSVTKAEVVARSETLPAFCKVNATLKPSRDSDIKMETWLPAADWNGKFEAVGNGGWSGSINPASLTPGLLRGYATAMTDLGHEGDRASFALGHPEKLIDFGYRAAHEMTLAAKFLVTSYYGKAPKLSYWNGCSAGGRSALMEAQRFPEDFDGIIAGAPGWNWTGRALQSVWIAQATHKSEAGSLPAAKYAVLHKAVLQACDALDGLIDGVLEDPTRCHFDPKPLECKTADGADCLTAAEVETARAMYGPVLNSRTKEFLFPGFEPGSESGWATMGSAKPFTIGQDLFKYVVFQNPDWDFKTFDFDKDLAATLTKAGSLNADNPDLKAFRQHGGKLLQYHGWNDPQIAPGISPRYYQAVLAAMGGGENVSGFYRLFMVPGMAHCRGGEGTSNFDMLSALEDWVEHGKAPASILATRLKDGKIDRTRPLCAYPATARYSGSGGEDDAANFVCQVQ